MKSASETLLRESTAKVANGTTTNTPAKTEEQVGIQRKHLLIGGGWMAFLGLWLNWSRLNGDYLLWESLPAFLVITLLLLIKMMGERP